MRSLGPGGIALIFCLGVSGMASAAPPAQETSHKPSEAILRERLESRAAFVRSADAHRADSVTVLIEEDRRRLGLKNVILASADFIREAQTALKSGDAARAEALAATAVRLSPDLPEGYWMWLIAIHQSDWTRLGEELQVAWRGVKVSLSSFRSRIAITSRAIAIGSVAFLGLFFLATLILWIRHLRCLAHDLARPLPVFFQSTEMVVLLSLGLLTLALTQSLGVTAVAMLALTFAYQSRQERILSSGLVGVYVLMPLLLSTFLSPLILFHGSRWDDLLEAESEAFARLDPKAELGLSPEQSQLSGTILARRLRLQGDLAGAEAEYRRSLKAGVEDSLVENNLAALLFDAQKVEEAEGLLRQAIRRNDRVEPFLNLATLLTERGGEVVSEVNRLLEAARAIDAEATETLRRQGSVFSAQSELLYANPNMAVLWSQLIKNIDPADRREMARVLWRPIGGAGPWWLSSVLGLGVFSLGLLRTRLKLTRSAGCTQCGLPVPDRAPLCSACQAVFGSAEYVDRSLRELKEAQVSRRERHKRRFALLLALIPGLSRIFRGHALWGALPVFIAGGLLATAFHVGDRVAISAWTIDLGTSAAFYLSRIALGLFGLMALASLMLEWRKE